MGLMREFLWVITGKTEAQRAEEAKYWASKEGQLKKKVLKMRRQKIRELEKIRDQARSSYYNVPCEVYHYGQGDAPWDKKFKADLKKYDRWLEKYERDQQRRL